LLIRGHKVMLDSNLADLYEVPTKVLNQAIRRNLGRFPSDFMFQLNKEEFVYWRSPIVTSNPRAKLRRLAIQSRQAPGLRRKHVALSVRVVAVALAPTPRSASIDDFNRFALS
jgi:hypothetical protein